MLLHPGNLWVNYVYVYYVYVLRLVRKKFGIILLITN